VEVGVIHNSLVDLLGAELVSRHVNLGRLVTGGGRLVEDYSAFKCRELALVRGNSKSPCSNCEECGAFLYFPVGHRYLVPECLPRAPLSESTIGQLVVEKESMTNIALEQLIDVDAELLEVLPSPKDGHCISRNGGRFCLDAHGEAPGN
jgi:hypothetical protein